MNKTRSSLLHIRRTQIVSILCLITLILTMVLIAKPIHAQSPYADLEVQLQQLQQQMDQLLVTYYSMKPEDRAQVDASMAAAMQQTLRQMYTSMSVTDRANLDEQTRQSMGYTFTQLLQMSSTVPGEAKMIGILSNFLRNYYGLTPPITTKPPTTTTKTTKPVTTTPPPTRDITFERPEQGGAVDFTTESFNLQLRQLYGASSSEQARDIYDKKVNASKQKLDTSNAKSKDRIKEIDAELSNLKLTSSPLDQQVLDFQQKRAMDKANQRVVDAWTDLVLAMPKMDPAGNAKLFGQDILEIRDRWNSGESLSRADWEKIGLATAGVIFVAAPFIVGTGSVVIPIGTGAFIASSGLELWSAYSNVNSLKEVSSKVQPNFEEYRRMLEYQRQSEQISIDYRLEREQRLLNLGFPVVQK